MFLGRFGLFRPKEAPKILEHLWLITVWLQVRVLLGPPIFLFLGVFWCCRKPCVSRLSPWYLVVDACLALRGIAINPLVQAMVSQP
jgi:hypothetical protein